MSGQSTKIQRPTRPTDVGEHQDGASPAYATIKGFEVMRALRKGQAGMFALQDGIVSEAGIVERAFGIGPCALTEVMAPLQDRPANAEA